MVYSPSFSVTCGECFAETRVLGAYKSGLSWEGLQARLREHLALAGLALRRRKGHLPDVRGRGGQAMSTVVRSTGYMEKQVADAEAALAAMTQRRDTLQADLLLAETHIGQQAREAQTARRERLALHAEVRGLMEKLDE